MDLSLYDEDLRKIIGKEVTIDLLTKMNITTMEQYNNYFKEDNKQQEEKDKQKRKKEEKKKISNSKMKANLRKKEMVLNKKLKNEMRSKIMESLEKYKVVDLVNLDSAKNLGKKRKPSKDIVGKSQEEEVEVKPEVEESEQEVSFDSDSESCNSIQIKYNNINPNSQELPVNQETIISNILNEKRQNRLKEEQLMDIEYELTKFDLENLTQENLDKLLTPQNIQLDIPDKSNLILVERTENIQNDRITLPIVKYEHEIMDKINNSLVTVVCGETGSGKSTQIPQFLYEYGYTKAFGKIIVTQPRRVAAISLATRVAEELNVKVGEEVGYQVRFDSSHYSDKTAIKYVTDGILLKELESDKLLLKYSVIMIDEAHERTINTDIIIGLISKLVKLRFLLSKNQVKTKSGEKVAPLRLIIMSATMRVDEFLESSVFKPNIVPSFIKVEARRHPVTVHHSKRTNPDYIQEAFKLCCKIHSKLPDGGILIFLTGKNEINQLCEVLKQEFESKLDFTVENKEKENVPIENITNINEKTENTEKTEPHTENNAEEYKLEEEENEEMPASYKPFLILPLYSSLPQEQQLKIFDKLPENKRLIVIATNVAETSLTIPNIRYVIDTGRFKNRVFQSGLSFSTFKIDWISQASAEQRTGRAGRTGPGYCYRLYSNGLFAKLDQYTPPQILSSPLDSTILYLKSLNIGDISKFPFLTFPKKKFVEKTLRHLLLIGALSTDEESDFNIVKNFINLTEDEKVGEEIDYKDNTIITDVGKLMVKFPIPPKLGKVLILSNKLKLLEYGIILASVLNSENLFVIENKKEETVQVDKTEKKNQKDLKSIIENKLLNPFSDAITFTNLILSLLKQDFDKNYIFNQFCAKYLLNIKKVKEMLDTISQIIKISNSIFFDNKNANFSMGVNKMYKNLPDLDSVQQNMLIQALLSGFIDNIARRRVIYDQLGNEKSIHKKVIFECNENNQQCQIHPYSVVSKSNPDFVIYKEIIQENKTFLICNTIIKPEWIYNLGGDIVSYSVLKDSALNEPFYTYADDTINCYVDIKYGYKNWDIPKVKVTLGLEDENYFRYLARFILEGKVIKELAEFERFLNSKPRQITSQISINPKVTVLINTLKFNKIYNRSDLLKIFKNRRNFLLDAYLSWFDDHKLKDRIKTRWPFVKV